MNDDEVMDQLLKDAMASPPPHLSSGFDAEVMRAVQPRRLTPMGRAVITAYAVVATVSAVWLMRDLRVELIGVAIAMTIPVAAGASAYVRRLAADQ
jgi:hypothetical protein